MNGDLLVERLRTGDEDEALATICREGPCSEMFVLTNRSNAAAMALCRATGGQMEADDEQMFVYPFRTHPRQAARR